MVRILAQPNQYFFLLYSSVSDMLDELGWPPLSQRRQEARLILFYKIINGLAQVPFEGVLIEAYMGTRRKHNMKFREIGHTTECNEPTPALCNLNGGKVMYFVCV